MTNPELHGPELADALLDAPAGEIAAAVAAGTVKALAMTEAAIARIEARNGPINAVVVRDFDEARIAARRLDQQRGRGPLPLLGVPMTVKEAHNVAGLPTTWGSEMFGDWIAPRDSVAVERLKAAGAVILGKTNVPPFLSDWQSANPVYGRTVNPWDPARTPGGSSGGSAAALAAGMVPLELGSDIGGSIRIPAAFCGVYGHKPTHDLVPLRGHAPPGVDGAGVALGVVGPMARTAGDLRLALEVMAGPVLPAARWLSASLPAPRGDSLADFRILVLDHHPLAATSREGVSALHRAADAATSAGARVARTAADLPDLAAGHHVYMEMLNTITSRGGPSPDGPGAHGWMDLLDAQLANQRQWARVFEAFDIVLAPNFGTVAYPHDVTADMAGRVLTIDGAPTPYIAQLAWPGIATLANLPATAFPAGLSSAGLPVGLQAIGPAFEDLTPIRFAELMAEVLGGFRAPG